MTKQKALSQKEKCASFETLHRGETFIIPNPWDAGSAKILKGLGYKALATTSAGLAYTLGRADGNVSLAEKEAHCKLLVTVTSIPINADFENGFADDPETVAINVLKIAETGIAGCSIEDFSRDSKKIYDFNAAVDRIQAAAEAVASLDMPFQLTARAENLLRGVDNMDDTIKRLQAFESAGANVLYAPGLHQLSQLREVTSAVNKPFNVLAPFFNKASIEDFSHAGTKRISVGGALHYAAISPLLSAAKEMMEHGTFAWLGNMAPGKEVASLLSA
ncbi:MAG: 2-methylisocitrate lyase-like PEP mutase family enzyme [Candidatus Azotimanducaceae bacterium]|jgi:2-methylisocitrate lyase-like PEP mutase family enzyme